MYSLLVVCMVLAGCSGLDETVGPDSATTVQVDHIQYPEPSRSPNIIMPDREGSETLGEPSIPIAAGSGFVEAGVGMVAQPATVEFYVPGAIEQVLVYWSGGTDESPYLGDDTIEFDGTTVTGTLIGGPSYFYNAYWFAAYRADITDLSLVDSGDNSLTASGMDFPYSSGNENSGMAIVVIYSDGSEADILVRDGLDLAFFGFSEPRQTTVPQGFTFTAASTARTADLAILCGSVGANRPNQVLVEIDGGQQHFENQLGSVDGEHWDTLLLPVLVPAGASSLTVQVISTVSDDPLGASLSWVAAALSVPREEIPPPPEGCTRTIGHWKNHCGIGNGNQADEVTPLLPIWLGDAGGTKSLEVIDAQMAHDVLEKKTYGRNRNGVTKLYAQLLAAKLNFANGADDADVAETVADADAWLTENDWTDWGGLSDDDQDMVLDWKDALDAYNNGFTGPGHCDDD